jgi:hypothetical protein
MTIVKSTCGNSELLLAVVVAEWKPRGVVTYRALSDAIGSDVRKSTRNKSALYSALNKARRLYGFEFEAIANVGYECLDNVGRIGKQERYLRSTYNAAKRGLRTVENVNLAELDDSAKTRVLTQTSLLGAVRLGTSRQAVLVESKKSQVKLSLPDFGKK